ncbi:cell division protein ZapA [Caldovatus aquaticus]|uniref:Cell division protein ZapA n=1 Tax=Caldovatus aquaticus TaxID=2865671 RepID=A0ABS7F3E1_9PROT|nr:cell division protein ZapA [Caldovatus aquaticus]MBW8270053.1 cell division protein ZapA [Caldovatus aquaticus]
MGQVTIRVGGYAHPVACQDGQEEHLQRMAAEVDQRIGALRAMGMQFGEARMLLLAALQLADEASDLRAELAALKAGAAGPAPPPAAPAAEPELAARLARLAERLEGIAAALEAP